MGPLDAITETLTSMRCSFTAERGLQDGIERALLAAGIAATREAPLTKRDRVDFLAGDIAIEVKVDGSLADVTRQLHRYAACPEVSALVLVTTRGAHTRLPDTLGGKPVRVVHLLWRSL